MWTLLFPPVADNNVCMAYRNAISVIAVTLAFLFLTSFEAAAQEARSFEQLQVLIKPGDKVYVTDATGNETKGKLEGLSRSSLRLTVNGSTRDLAESDVFKVRQWRHDSVKNGAIIGAVTGLGLGIITLAVICHDDFISDCGAGGVVASMAVYTGLGAAAGVGIDALIPSKQTVFIGGTRTSLNRFKVQPILSRSHKGIAVSMSF